jgi:hypothetical protein
MFRIKLPGICGCLSNSCYISYEKWPTSEYTYIKIYYIVIRVACSLVHVSATCRSHLQGDVLWRNNTLFYRCVYGCMFCILLFNSVSHVFLLLCLCILIVFMLCSVYSIFIVPTAILRLPWLKFFRAFSSVVRQMPGCTSQRRGTVRTLPN